MVHGVHRSVAGSMATASVLQLREKRISVRLMWPFLRIINSSPSPLTTQILEEAGVSPVDLARPETRLPHRLMMSILESWVERTGDQSIGLRAGASVEPGDSRCDRVRRAKLRDAGRGARVRRAVHPPRQRGGRGVHRRLRRRCPLALSHHRRSPQPRAANDFVIASAARFALRCATIDRMPREIHFMHDAPADMSTTWRSARRR